MKRIAYDLRYFLIPTVLWILTGLGIILLTDKEELHLAINAYNHPLMDNVFKYITHLGDGIFAALIVLLGFIYSVRYGVIGLLGLSVASTITQVLKRNVFADHHRPASFFKELADFHFVDGVSLHTHFSFPSGHATAAFCTFFFLAYIGARPWLQVSAFVLGWITAFSRVYISQHYFEDIYAGSIIGTGVLFFSIVLLHHKQWGNKGLTAMLDTK